jgi:hypothetical protein
MCDNGHFAFVGVNAFSKAHNKSRWVWDYMPWLSYLPVF